MLRTVAIGNHLTVQGIFVKMLKDGFMEVKVGSRVFAGRPVSG